MTEVYFYLSKTDEGGNALFDLTRRIAQAAKQRNRQVYIHCRDADQCQQLDDWLWQEPRSSFMPHSRDASQVASVVLGHHDVPSNQQDVLINLAATSPDFFSRFQRVAEPVSNNENERKAARERWLYYRDRGYSVKKLDI